MMAVVYQLASGEIQRIVDCPEEMLELQAGPGELVAVADGDVSDATHFVVGLAVVAYTQAQAAVKAARPRYAAEWSNATMQWSDLRTIDQVRDDRWSTMKDAREAFELGGFTWDESVFDSDTDSQNRILLYVTKAKQAQAEGTPFSEVWTLKDNSERVLDARHDRRRQRPGQLRPAQLAAAARGRGAHGNARQPAEQAARVVGVAHADAATGDDCVGHLRCFRKSLFQQRRLVSHNAHVNHLAAQVLQHAKNGVAVTVVHRAFAWRFA